MKEQDIEDFRAAIFLFVQSCDKRYWWPAAERTAFPTSIESILLTWLLSSRLTNEEKSGWLCVDASPTDAYSLAIFSIRLAGFATRASSVSIFRVAMMTFVAISRKIDWRDVLEALTLLENCGDRLGLEFHDEVDRIEDEALRLRIVDGYQRRS